MKKLEKAADDGNLEEATALNREEFNPQYLKQFGRGNTRDNEEARLYDLARNNLLYSFEDAGMFPSEECKEHLKEAKRYIRELEHLAPHP